MRTLGILTIAVPEAMDQFLHPLRKRIVTRRENVLQPTFIDGAYRVAAS
jgi:hypothetical protein